jgi:hypothetical protein
MMMMMMMMFAVKFIIEERKKEVFFFTDFRVPERAIIPIWGEQNAMCAAIFSSVAFLTATWQVY